MYNSDQLAKVLSRGIELSNKSIGIKSTQPLTEAQGWKEIVQDIKDPMKRATTAIILENYKNYRLGLDEATSTLQIGNFDKFAFPILTIVSENLIAQDLVSMQPLDGPSGMIFYMNFTTGQQKGDTSRGAKIWDSRTGHADRNTDSDSVVNNEYVGSVSSTLSATLSYAPVMPGSVNLTDSSGATYTDTGNGVLVDISGSTVGSINYNTGGIAITSGVANGTLEGSYYYNAELNPDAQQVDFEIVSAPIYTKERKLRGRWSMEAAKAMEALHKVNAESSVSNAITNHLQWEIDREVIEDLRRCASGGTVSWNAQIPSAAHISYTEHKLSFVDAVINASNFIQRATNRVKANWMLLGIQPSGVVESLPMFDATSGEKAETEGVSELGKLGRVKCYTDPHYRMNEALVGYKGKDFVRTGYVLAPWLLAITTPLVTLDDFIARKGFASIYGKKIVNSRMYATIECSGFTASFGG